MYSFYIIAKILFAYATFASFLLQFYVPMDFLEPAILEKMKLNTTTRSEFKVIVQVFFRSVTVLFIGELQIEKKTFTIFLLVLYILYHCYLLDLVSK